MLDTDTFPPRRSCLAVPGSSSRKLEKAVDIAADELVLDLEDAVVPAVKDDARKAVLFATARLSSERTRIAVRVNAPRTPWCHRDLVALAGLTQPPRSIVLPKVECAGDLEFVDRLLDGAEEGRRPMRVQALIETAAGLVHLDEIAAASERLEALIVGYADLGASMGRRAASADSESWRFAQDAVLVAARANSLQAIDGPYLGIEVDADFQVAATCTRDLGFDGKWAIHPSQVEVLNELFAPAPEEVDRACAVIAALDRAERENGAGAVALDGEMLDKAVRASALRVLARADAAGRR